ncbi:DUF1403 family protein (plasmid) [Methylocystis sp. MJC1]|uniref:DUF1403 family protein n=1 Tax=Methylocystis sp. MJC1 TaxID=2654282 RepID=UPI0013ECAA4B|nr:DUF1403 family protein [Methylocystis sp. MJC1]KAF2988757.1 hypothetical protein MJC1_04167 [Methylocystis sp. MJC1]MBU6529074.1 DUF1403 family protein [Methylocystis sp. MJC1]UZX14014.1 DUF1403 family protein [Methylocystis sp. MJC1]
MTALAPFAHRPRKKPAAGADEAGRNALPANAFPKWARAPAGALDSMSDVEAAVLAGASLAALDAVVTGGQGEAPSFLGVLRARQARAAAAHCAQAARLREDDAALRDALALAAPAAALSPAGRLYALFRLFGAARFKGDQDDVERAGELLGLSGDVTAYVEIVRAHVVGAREPLGRSIAAAAAIARRAGADGARAETAELLALWAADLVLAKRLGWDRPLALLAPRVSEMRDATGRRLRPGDSGWPSAALRAYARAAADVHLAAVDLERRATTLVALLPKLRAKPAGRVVALLLADDGVTPAAAARATGMSDRAARRLFDRLVDLGGARELTGRESFRIYGL